jgi:hypothetical protein
VWVGAGESIGIQTHGGAVRVSEYTLATGGAGESIGIQVWVGTGESIGIQAQGGAVRVS